MEPSPTSPITRDDVLRIAGLAHLELSPPEIEKMTRELGDILAYVKQLEAVDVSGIPPTAHVQIERLPLRPDEPEPSFSQEQALRAAPRAAEGGFAVPAFVDEG